MLVDKKAIFRVRIIDEKDNRSRSFTVYNQSVVISLDEFTEKLKYLVKQIEVGE